jgi:hypothetical protein
MEGNTRLLLHLLDKGLIWAIDAVVSTQMVPSDIITAERNELSQISVSSKKLSRIIARCPNCLHNRIASSVNGSPLSPHNGLDSTRFFDVAREGRNFRNGDDDLMAYEYAVVIFVVHDLP